MNIDPLFTLIEKRRTDDARTMLDQLPTSALLALRNNINTLDQMIRQQLTERSITPNPAP